MPGFVKESRVQGIGKTPLDGRAQKCAQLGTIAQYQLKGRGLLLESGINDLDGEISRYLLHSRARFGLITQRSLVQIQPPQPNLSDKSLSSKGFNIWGGGRLFLFGLDYGKL